MGILKKVNCCLCEKELRVTRRTKILDGKYICDECRKATNPYVHLDRCSKEEVANMILKMQRDNQILEMMKASMEEESFSCGIHHYKLYTAESEKVFVLETIETETFKYTPIFEIDKVQKYSDFGHKKTDIKDTERRYVKVVTKLDDKGRPRIYYVKFLYNDPKIQEVKIRFEAAYVMEARKFCKLLNTFIQKNKS